MDEVIALVAVPLDDDAGVVAAGTTMRWSVHSRNYSCGDAPLAVPLRRRTSCQGTSPSCTKASRGVQWALPSR
jgi:hypothetical protein